MPLQRFQSPLSVSSGWVKRARSVKRSPHSAGGVASRRISWRRRPLRITSCTSASDSGGAPRCSSVQRSEPPRITNSGWRKNQLAAALLPLPGPLRSRPATKRCPCASRRTSRWASSISSWSKRSSRANSECADSAATMRGNTSAGCPPRSCSTTLCSSSVGIQPAERTLMLPIRTGTPSALVARSSIWGRHCWMCGKIPQCSVSQATSNKLHAAMTSPASTRAIQRKRAAIRARRERGAESAAVTGATMDMNELGSRQSARQDAVRSRAERRRFSGPSDSPSVPGAAAI